MKNDRWPQAKPILMEALELPLDERGAFLDRICAGDADLRADVATYLSAESEVEAFLERPVVDLLAARPLPSREGQRLGPFLLEKRLGQGGMGEVYLAHRADETFDQAVAVKILKRGLDTTEILHRFHQERQILANLEHPNIARIVDGGTSSDGLPYLVMEYVEGRPIHRYCEEQALPIHQRLDLFRTVCTAVHFAHQRLVVHRDLKPDNILVMADGTPKLLDFGIARILDSDEGSALTQTLRELRIMTPAWASPEQLLGHQVTTATDVYSLGVLLFQLLAGQAPFQKKGRTTQALIQEVLETASPKPSQSLPDPGEGLAVHRQLRRQLEGDLDTIVAKAMHKEAKRRYGSAAELGEDLRRHLASEPVVARPDSVWYRTRRFVRRNPLAVVAASLILILVTSFAGVLSAQLRRTEVERDRAEAARIRAETYQSTLYSILEAIDPSGLKEQTAKDAKKILAVAEEKMSDLAPIDQASLSNRLGLILDQLGFSDEGRALLLRSKQLFQDLDPKDKTEFADALNNLGMNAVRRDSIPEGEGLFLEALALLDAQGVDMPLTRAKINSNLVTVLERDGRYAEAEMAYRAILEVKRETHGEDSLEFAVTLNNLAACLVKQDKWQEGESLALEAVRIRREKLGAEHLGVATSLMNLAAAQGAKGDSQAEIDSYWEALRIRLASLPEKSPLVAQARGGLAFALLERGGKEDLHRAEEIFRSALSAYLATYPDHRYAQILRRNLADTLVRQERAVEAEPLARLAVEELRKSYGFGHWRIADAESVLGSALAQLGNFEEAEPLLVSSLPSIRKGTSENSRYARRAEKRLAEMRALEAR